MHYVYIIESIKTKRWYIGSSRDPDKRIHEHNAGCVTSTKPYRPYRIIYTEQFNTKTEALRRERQIKKSNGIKNEIKKSMNVAHSSSG